MAASRCVLPDHDFTVLSRPRRVPRPRGSCLAGCGSCEEPYTLAVIWESELRHRFPGLDVEIVATDADANVLRRAREGRYAFGSVKELPEHLREQAFCRDGDAYDLRPEYRRGVRFLEQDIREGQPEGCFDLVLCRNLVFTYFDEDWQRELLRRIAGTMHDGAALVLGTHEQLPDDVSGLRTWFDKHAIYRRESAVGRPAM